MTEKEIRRQFHMIPSVRGTRIRILISSIFTFFLGLLNLVISVLGPIFLSQYYDWSYSLGFIIIGIIHIALGIGILVWKSRVCSCCVTALAVINLVFIFFYRGRFEGWIGLFPSNR